jgi:hypothetical protein
MFNGQQDGTGQWRGGYLSQAQDIALEYEYNSMRRQPWHPSTTRSFVIGVGLGIFAGRKMARREDRGTNSGGPQGCF